MPHIMFDLETLDIKATAVVTQIGWAVFDPLGGPDKIYSGLLRCDPGPQIDLGRTMSWPTIQWWLKQSDQARAEMAMDGKLDMQKTLRSLQRDFDWSVITGVWSHGSLFDIPILADMFANLNEDVPWAFRHVYDTRTLWMLAPDILYEKPSISHQAEHDAFAQAMHCQKVMRRLKGMDSAAVNKS